MTLKIEAQIIPLRVDRDGVLRVGETRITLDIVVHAFDQGHTAEEIVSHYPVLKLADVYAIISYYLNNMVTVRDYLQGEANDAEELWQEIEAKPDYQVFRERLLSRYQANSKTIE